MEDPNKPPFIVGQQVVRKFYPRSRSKETYGGAFTIHIIDYQYGEWVVFDLYLTKHLARNCLCSSVYNSPLWESMKEEY